MGLHSIPGYDRWKLDHPDHYATDPEDCPAWLSEELAGNAAFVAEAFSECLDTIAAAHVQCGDISSTTPILIATHNAVASYIETVWEREGRDAREIARSWRAYESEQAKRRAAA